MSSRAARQRVFPHQLCAGHGAPPDAHRSASARRCSPSRLLVFPFIASTFYLDLATQVLLASIGALSLMLLTGYAGQISLGHAGLLAAGAFTAGILFKEFNAPIWLTLPAAAVSRRRAGRDLRAAVAAAARALSRGLDARAAFHRDLSSAANTKPSAASRPASSIDAPTHCRLQDLRRARLVLRAARARLRRRSDLHQPDAQPHRPRLARHPCARDGGRSARHQCRGATSCSPS